VDQVKITKGSVEDPNPDPADPDPNPHSSDPNPHSSDPNQHSSDPNFGPPGYESGSICQRNVSADPDPDQDRHQNVMDPQL
jgi:hypothetical protein